MWASIIHWKALQPSGMAQSMNKMTHKHASMPGLTDRARRLFGGTKLLGLTLRLVVMALRQIVRALKHSGMDCLWVIPAVSGNTASDIQTDRYTYRQA